MDKLPILVTGASRNSYGQGIAVGLNDQFDVWTMQRNPCLPLPSARWVEADLNEPHHTIRALQKLDNHIGPMQELPALQAVIHCASVSEKMPYSTITTFDIARAFTVNIAEPLMLTKYLLDHGLLEWTGHVIFLLDSRSFDIDLKIFEACKWAIPLFVDAMKESWSAVLTVKMLKPPRKLRQGAVAQTVAGVRGILANEYEESCIDLTKGLGV